MERKYGRVVRMRNTRQKRELSQVLSRLCTTIQCSDLEPFHFMFTTGVMNSMVYFIGKDDIYQTVRHNAASVRFDNKIAQLSSTISTTQNVVQEWYRKINSDGSIDAYSKSWNLNTNKMIFKHQILSIQLSDCVVTQKSVHVKISKWPNFNLTVERFERVWEIKELQNNTIVIGTNGKLYIIQNGDLRGSYGIHHNLHQLQNGDLLIFCWRYTVILNNNNRSVKCRQDSGLGYIRCFIEYKGTPILFNSEGIFLLHTENLTVDPFAIFEPLGRLGNVIQLNDDRMLVHSELLGLCLVDLSNSNYTRIILSEQVFCWGTKLRKITENFVFYCVHKTNKIYVLDIEDRTLTFICDGTSPQIIRTQADRDACRKNVESLLGDHVVEDVKSIVYDYIQ